LIVVGGSIYGGSPSNPRKVLATVEIYDPVADRWQGAAPLATPRSKPQARLLDDGTLLVISGDNKAQTGERYDPREDRWTPVAAPQQTHGDFTMTVLQDGRVLLLGGTADAGGAEIYDPATNTWTVVANPATIRSGHAATLLPNGEVLLTGGQVAEGKPTNTTERYDPRTNIWRADTPMLAMRRGHSAILVLDMIYVLGGGEGAERYRIETSDSRCFAETGRCVQGRFLAYWQEHGGLALNGYPLSAPFAERLENGKVYVVQYFERVRLEYHPENNAPNDVLLGQFGRRIHPADPAVPQQSGATYFPTTGHNLSGNFLAYWEASGGLAQFGYPLTETITETLEDGKPYRVQYFERARFEYHPENPAPYDVLLGQFGRRILAGR
ncbi:MAG TPA: kelch repeat-containing protein, partial [Thermomicrobiales bacterium]